MRRIGGVLLAAGTLFGCGSGTGTGTQGDLTINLGTLPAVVAANADSAFIRVRNTTLGVNEVRRVGLQSSSVTVTVTGGTGYEVSVVTLISGTLNFAIGGGMVENVTVEAEGSASTTVPIEQWTADPAEIPANFTAGQMAFVTAKLNGSRIREITDAAPVGMNLIFSPAPTADDYFQMEDRFFAPTPGDSVVFNITVPSTTSPTELWLHIRWSASTTSANWTTGFPFEISLPTIALGDTLWWSPVAVP
jgi:hypothetical protein